LESFIVAINALKIDLDLRCRIDLEYENHADV
jgi:hypothetical protein